MVSEGGALTPFVLPAAVAWMCVCVCVYVWRDQILAVPLDGSLMMAFYR